MANQSEANFHGENKIRWIIRQALTLRCRLRLGANGPFVPTLNVFAHFRAHLFLPHVQPFHHNFPIYIGSHFGCMLRPKPQLK